MVVVIVIVVIATGEVLDEIHDEGLWCFPTESFFCLKSEKYFGCLQSLMNRNRGCELKRRKTHDRLKVA